jgi:large subunit ribosomal protein L21
MYAVVETGGKQIRVREGDVVEIEKLDARVGDEVIFDRVLCLAGDGRLIPGNPTVPGAVVVGRVEAQVRGRKIVVLRYKAKVNYHKKTGHRQALTRVRITEIRHGRRDTAEEGATELPAAGEAGA